MKVPETYAKFFHHLESGERVTLRDDQTTLYILVQNEMYYVDVDRGIIQNVRQQIKKCDFLCYDELNRNCHLIELKGAVIKEAQKQILETLQNIKADDQISFYWKSCNGWMPILSALGVRRFPEGSMM